MLVRTSRKVLDEVYQSLLNIYFEQTTLIKFKSAKTLYSLFHLSVLQEGKVQENKMKWDWNYTATMEDPNVKIKTVYY